MNASDGSSSEDEEGGVLPLDDSFETDLQITTLKSFVDSKNWNEMKIFVLLLEPHTNQRYLKRFNLVVFLGYMITNCMNPPLDLTSCIMHKVVEMTMRQEENLLTMSHKRCDGIGLFNLVLYWYRNRLEKDALEQFLYHPTPGAKDVNAVDMCWGHCLLLLESKDLLSILPLEPNSCIPESPNWCFTEAITKTLDIAHSIQGDKWKQLPLHSILATPCPNIAVHVALEYYGVEIGEKDLEGNLPLHVAAAYPLHHALIWDTCDESINLLGDLNFCPATCMVLDKYPQAASIPNSAGRFPLNLAIENHGRWERSCQDRDEREEFWKNMEETHRDFFSEMILELVRAAPEALEVRDAKTHLYPFLLAASVDAPLSMVYNLLQANPMVVRPGMVGTDGELFLECMVNLFKENQQADQEVGSESLGLESQNPLMCHEDLSSDAESDSRKRKREDF